MSETCQHRVASLWIGDRLSILEKLCLKSFADIGQTPILYTYNKISNLPDFVEHRDARSVLPLGKDGRIFRDPVQHSAAVHADIFRLHLMQKTEEIWVDCDAYAIKPFAPRDGYLIAGRRDGQRRVHNGVMRLPRESKALAGWLELTRQVPCIPPWWPRETQRQFRKLFGRQVHFATLPLGTIGPLAAYHYLLESGEIAHVLPERELYALPFSTRRSWFAPDATVLDEFDWQTKTSIHFFSSIFNRLLGRRKNAIPRSSLIGQLLLQHQLDRDPDITLVDA